MTEIQKVEIQHGTHNTESSVTDKKVVILLKPKIKPKAIIKLVPLIAKHIPVHLSELDTRSELSDQLNESYLDDSSIMSSTPKITPKNTPKTIPALTSTPTPKTTPAQTSKTTQTPKTTQTLKKHNLEPPKVISKENTYSRWIFGEQLLISTEDNTYIYDPKDLSLIGKVLDESNIEWY